MYVVYGFFCHHPLTADLLPLATVTRVGTPEVGICRWCVT